MSITTPIPTKSQHKPEDRRTAILDAALELFTRQGYDATSIDQIRIASGFKSKASLYTHFNSKEEISTALTTTILAKTERIIKEADNLSIDDNPLTRFTVVFRAYIKWTQEHREEYAFRITRAQELRMLDGKYDFEKEEGEDFAVNLYARFINILESLRPNYPVRKTTDAALFNMLIGVMCRATIDRDSFGDITLEEKVEEIFQVCVGVVFTSSPHDWIRRSPYTVLQRETK